MNRKSFLLIVICLLILACSFLGTATPEVIKETVVVEVTRELNNEIVITATPKPTQVPTELPPVILEDPFDADTGDWVTGEFDDSSAEITEGGLILSVHETNMMISSWHTEFDPFDLPFDLTVDVYPLEVIPDAFASIEFRYIDEENVADFSIDGYGQYSFGSFIDGDYYEIIPWTRSAAISRRQNSIRVLDYGDRVIVFCNGELLFNIPFEDIPPGSLGFSVSTYEEGTASFMFDNVVLREIP
jgi:hypothetical protein